MTLRLKLLKETDKARRYELASGERLWIPRSVVKSTTKFSNDIHELNIEDWWWEKHWNNEQDTSTEL